MDGKWIAGETLPGAGSLSILCYIWVYGFMPRIIIWGGVIS